MDWIRFGNHEGQITSRVLEASSIVVMKQTLSDSNNVGKT